MTHLYSDLYQLLFTVNRIHLKVRFRNGFFRILLSFGLLNKIQITNLKSFSDCKTQFKIGHVNEAVCFEKKKIIFSI
jgi:hypothetical protein